MNLLTFPAMYPIPPTETLVKTKVCKYCESSFPITDKDMEFYEKVSPVFSGKKYKIPSPTLCPDCRQQRRLSWRNRRKMYKRKCDATGRDIISMFSPDKPYKVYHTREWESDRWDSKSYGREYDFSRSFFEQYDELLKSVPLPHLAVIESTLENSEYVNGANNTKNAYLSNNIVGVDGVYYSEAIYFSNQIVDCLGMKNSDTCYECVSCLNIHDGSFLFECQSCDQCSFCQFCSGCNNCIGCVNLTNKSYYIFNVEYSPDAYEKMKQSLEKAEITRQLQKLTGSAPLKFAKIINSQNVIGNDIINSSNCSYSFDIADSEDIRYSVFVTGNSQDCYDINFWGQGISLCYEGAAIGINSSKVLFSAETYSNANNCLYCFFCYPNNDYLFGCVGMENARYCILNKQYTKEQYGELVPRIIEHMQKTGEWGEFFPSILSPFGYNETLAMSYFPLNRSNVISKKKDTTSESETFLGGDAFNWSDYEPPFPKVEKIIPASKLPENIKDIPDDILNWAIECEVTHKPFRIIKQELEFYRKHNLPIPRRHPDQRVVDRMKSRNPWRLFERKCDKCGVEMITTYSSERPEIVYCEKCYEKEVIG